MLRGNCMIYDHHREVWKNPSWRATIFIKYSIFVPSLNWIINLSNIIKVLCCVTKVGRIYTARSALWTTFIRQRRENLLAKERVVWMTTMTIGYKKAEPFASEHLRTWMNQTASQQVSRRFYEILRKMTINFAKWHIRLSFDIFHSVFEIVVKPETRKWFGPVNGMLWQLLHSEKWFKLGSSFIRAILKVNTGNRNHFNDSGS